MLYFFQLTYWLEFFAVIFVLLAAKSIFQVGRKYSLRDLLLIVAIVATSLWVGIILSTIYVAAWITLVSEHGAAAAMRIGFTAWPGNVIGMVLFALSVF